MLHVSDLTVYYIGPRTIDNIVLYLETFKNYYFQKSHIRLLDIKENSSARTTY